MKYTDPTAGFPTAAYRDHPPIASMSGHQQIPQSASSTSASASSVAATLQSLNVDLVKHIDSLRRDLRTVTQALSHAHDRKQHLTRQLADLQADLAQVDATLAGLGDVKVRLERSLADADATFQSIVDSSKRLLTQVQLDAEAVRQVVGAGAAARRTGGGGT